MQIVNATLFASGFLLLQLFVWLVGMLLYSNVGKK